MNICILTKSTLAHQIGGMEVHAMTLAETAAGLGHKVEVITTRHPEGVEYDEKNHVSFHYLKDVEPARYSKSWWTQSEAKMVELHDKSRIDIIWAESFSGYYYACSARKLLGVPIISIMHGGGMRGCIKSGWGAISSWKDLLNFMAKYLPESIFVFLPLFTKTLKYSDAIIAVSDETALSIQKEHSISPEKIFTIYNGVDTDTFKPDSKIRGNMREKYRLADDDKVIIMAGVVHRQKGMHLGLEAFRGIKGEISNCKMLVVGDGPDLCFLKKLAEDLKIAKDVIFCGYISNKDTSSYYNAADLFLNPTLRYEGLPIVMIEAMSCALPVVASHIGGIPSMLTEGVNGYLCLPGDIGSLANRAVEILSDPVLAGNMGENARKGSVQKFSAEKMVDDYLDVSRRLIRT
jgi:glycosyltransferase involved in cell wall biosynthesis